MPVAGDDNLGTTQALQALQRDHNEDPVWEVFDALAHGGGDHIAVSGAAARLLALPVGNSSRDPGLRKDHHAAVAVVRTVGLPDIGTADTENPDSRGASQPAASDTYGGPSAEATPETQRVSLSSDEDETPQPALLLLSSRTQRRTPLSCTT